ncbi:MAG: ribonuclease HII [Desulfurococcaceae archaeon]
MKTSDKVLIGVDEAGRGPLIGDMVIVAVAIPQYMENTLLNEGVRDSKTLNPEKRRRLSYFLLGSDLLSVAVYVPPWRIDESNLNDVEARYIGKALGMLSRVLNKLQPSEVHVYVDEVKGRSEMIKKHVASMFRACERLNVRVEPDADAKYTAVSVASILAKVFRDSSLTPLRRIFGDFGSGYASDSRTISWVSSYYASRREPPVFIRRTWRTLRNIAPDWYTSKRRTSGYRTLLDYVKR